MKYRTKLFTFVVALVCHLHRPASICFSPSARRPVSRGSTSQAPFDSSDRRCLAGFFSRREHPYAQGPIIYYSAENCRRSERPKGAKKRGWSVSSRLYRHPKIIVWSSTALIPKSVSSFASRWRLSVAIAAIAGNSGSHQLNDPSESEQFRVLGLTR
jgi:hypothetical protein